MGPDLDSPCWDSSKGEGFSLFRWPGPVTLIPQFLSASFGCGRICSKCLPVAYGRSERHFGELPAGPTPRSLGGIWFLGLISSCTLGGHCQSLGCGQSDLGGCAFHPGSRFSRCLRGVSWSLVTRLRQGTGFIWEVPGHVVFPLIVSAFTG